MHIVRNLRRNTLKNTRTHFEIFVFIVQTLLVLMLVQSERAIKLSTQLCQYNIWQLVEAVRYVALAVAIRLPSFVSRCGLMLRSVVEQAQNVDS